MTADVRSLVMVPGHCSACKGPAEKHAGSGHWWHVEGVCEWRSVWAFVPLAVRPLDRGGCEIGPLEVDLPARFIPSDQEAT